MLYQAGKQARTLSHRVHGKQVLIHPGSFRIVRTFHLPRCHKRLQCTTSTAKVPPRNTIEDQGATDAMALERL
jgi:hypothetical protein